MESMLDIDIENLIALLYEVDLYHNWMPYVK